MPTVLPGCANAIDPKLPQGRAFAPSPVSLWVSPHSALVLYWRVLCTTHTTRHWLQALNERLLDLLVSTMLSLVVIAEPGNLHDLEVTANIADYLLGWTPTTYL